MGNSDRQGPPDSGGPELACLSCVGFKASWVGFSDCSFKHPLHQPSRNRGLQENWQLFWGQWVVVLVTEEGEGKEGIMFPAGHTQVNSSLASPDYMGPGLGLREAALPLPPGSA